MNGLQKLWLLDPAEDPAAGFDLLLDLLYRLRPAELDRSAQQNHLPGAPGPSRGEGPAWDALCRRRQARRQTQL